MTTRDFREQGGREILVAPVDMIGRTCNVHASACRTCGVKNAPWVYVRCMTETARP